MQSHPKLLDFDRFNRSVRTHGHHLPVSRNSDYIKQLYVSVDSWKPYSQRAIEEAFEDLSATLNYTFTKPSSRYTESPVSHAEKH
jgi:hypothetical protein